MTDIRAGTMDMDVSGQRTGIVAKMKRRGGRGDQSPLGTWFWDIDRMLLLLTLFLIAIGLIAVAAASPASAVRYSGEHLTKIAPGVCMFQGNWPALQGPHNAQNALAAIAVVKALGVSEVDIDRGLASFTGLPHRMQQIAAYGGVAYVDDSKATNPESTAPALAAFDRVHWIVGGRAKGDDLDACKPAFGRVVRAYTIGEAGPRFAEILKDSMPVENVGTLDAAVRSAAANARPGDTVLLSPACASFDQFRDYEARGAAFRDAVESLA